MKTRLVLAYVAIALILLGTVGAIISLVPQIESLLVALVGHGYTYLALSVCGGVLLFFSRRKPPEEVVNSTPVV